MTDGSDTIERKTYDESKATHPDVPDFEIHIAVERALKDAHEWYPSAREGMRIHDWRTHVGEAVARTWAATPLPIRVSIALDAERQTATEEWD